MELNDKSYVIASTNYPLNVQVYNTDGENIKDIPLGKMLQNITHPINCVVLDGTCLWLGTYEGGLIRYDFNDNTIRRFLVNNTPTLKSNLIKSICLDSKNRMWIGTNKGLHLLKPNERDKSQPKFKVYNYSENDPSSISYNYVLPIIETTDKDIWIGTLGGGLNKYDEESDSFINFTTKDGLLNNNIKGIVEDGNQRLWLSSNKGISCLNLSNKQVLNFSVSDGLQDYEFREMSYTKRKSGEILFGGNKGFNAFCPDQIAIDSTNVNIVFTELQFKGSKGNKDLVINRAKLAEYLKFNNTITLKYSENSFTAYFTALDYFAPQKINYKYRLVGFEDEWNVIDAQSRFAKYTNLDPGNYKLEVLATNSDGIWATTPLPMLLKINNPWYKTIYAYLTYGLLITIFIYLFKRFTFIRNKMKQELLMERFQKEKEKELTQIKLQFFTNISHELRTPITIIKSYLENVVPSWDKLPKEKVNHDFSVIGRNVDDLLRLVSQILDFRKLEQDKMKLLPAKGDIVNFTETIIESFQALASQKNINLQFISKSQPIDLWFDEDKMHKIISNIISNAIKYTPKGGRVSIQITELDSEVKIEVRDTGVGIPEEEKSHIFERFYEVNYLKSINKLSTGIGLSLTEGLLNLHKGRIELDSTVGKGSNFILYFKKGNGHFNDETKIGLENSKSIAQNISREENSVELEPMPTSFKKKLVLIVEDNDDLRSFLKDKLKTSFKVKQASNGKEGLEKCKDIIPDLVISDIMMPEMNGYELCDAIKSNEAISHIPVILLTAKTTNESKLQGFNLGADAYVNKPFNWDVLLAQIVSIIKTREKIWKRIGENPYFKASEITFTARDEHFLSKITGLIEEHMFDSNFSVTRLADLYQTSQDTINNKLKALTGKTCVQYIRFIRLRKAAQLLKLKQNRISDVTYEVGYSDLQHFREHFKKEFSISPSAYKKKHSEDDK